MTCPYCDTECNDLDACPACGASREEMAKATQPTTIEELAQWYQARHLPPYEVTRFFIGQNVQEPRAFGIYHNPDTGNYVVYKNKGNGQRAIRYRGSDEAYAVSELLARLKQEIRSQKANQSGKRSGGKQKRSGCLTPVLVLLAAAVAILVGWLTPILQDMPKDGYYDYQQRLYYHFDHQNPDGYSDWFWYDQVLGDWSGPILQSDLPGQLKKNKQAQAYYLSADAVPPAANVGFPDSALYQDAKAGYSVDSGYYEYEDTTYYHLLNSGFDGWYWYDISAGSWLEVEIPLIPDPLHFASQAEAYYYASHWDSEATFTDFTQTNYYDNYQRELQRAQEDDHDDSSYDWDSSDTWDSSTTDWDSDW